MYSVYILYSEKLQKFYIGFTGNFAKRLAFHNDLDRNDIWTRKGIPWIKYFEITDLSEYQARGIERHIKRMKSKRYIENLSRYPEMIEKLKVRYSG
ncbi:MAG TPA: GIY-YIG nuclease family protein [Fulvivirga sp.]|nr:GIY-YIG nuclease family protein [Fulvivirga sp.]